MNFESMKFKSILAGAQAKPARISFTKTHCRMNRAAVALIGVKAGDGVDLKVSDCGSAMMIERKDGGRRVGEIKCGAMTFSCSTPIRDYGLRSLTAKPTLIETENCKSMAFPIKRAKNEDCQEHG